MVSPFIERSTAWKNIQSRRRTENIEAIQSSITHFLSHQPRHLAKSLSLATHHPESRKGPCPPPRVCIDLNKASDLPDPTTKARTPPGPPTKVNLPMCIYVQTIPLCGHSPPTLLAYASCNDVLAQLMRITEPEAWESENIDKVPFDMPDDCDPGPDNIYVLYSDDYCGWECRNNAYQQVAAGLRGFDDEAGGFLPACFPGDERGQLVGGGHGGDRRLMVVGMPDANYGPGSERLGIGWRSV